LGNVTSGDGGTVTVGADVVAEGAAVVVDTDDATVVVGTVEVAPSSLEELQAATTSPRPMITVPTDVAVIGASTDGALVLFPLTERGPCDAVPSGDSSDRLLHDVTPSIRVGQILDN
jgi:hypothetical protein